MALSGDVSLSLQLIAAAAALGLRAGGSRKYTLISAGWKG